tara:strand:+ start:363 stop:524 length:162 start_codon:yes stop_codon:yes gene_type:complete
MRQGTIDLLILLIIFLGLQAWWIYPILFKNRKLNKKAINLQEKIESLERLYKR